VLLGASSFGRAPKLSQGRAFYNSAQDFHEYLTAADGLGIPSENVLWLFDDSRSASDQLKDIRDFLEMRTTALKNQETQPKDLIVYYVGHGLFSGPEHAYCLAIRTTDEQSEGLTSMRVSDLASVVRTSARFLRTFLILDCCFSAAAYREFQSGPLTASRVKLLDELPQRGTTMLCSASSQDPSLAPRGLSRTMFSDSLLIALHDGHPSFGSSMTLSELGDLVKTNLRQAFPEDWVRPEVHSPDQREGDVAGVPLFPNAAWTGHQAEEGLGKADTQERQRDIEAQTDRKTRAHEFGTPRPREPRKPKEAEAPREQKFSYSKTIGLAVLTVALAWVSEVATGFAVLLFDAHWGWPIGGVLSGLVTGWAIRRFLPSLRRDQLLMASLAWSIGWVVTTHLQPVGSISGAIGAAFIFWQPTRRQQHKLRYPVGEKQK
jgi:hypothetical protein